MPPLNDLTGTRYGRLVAVERTGMRLGQALWLCRCDCGNTVEVKAGSLRNGNTKSCGCLKQERATVSDLNPNYRHGASVDGPSPTYRTWKAMIQRCTNVKNKEWHNYGGRGITVCERWLTSFADFLADMGVRPPDRTLDRIDGNGNYEPGNCRWATHHEQRVNRR